MRRALSKSNNMKVGTSTLLVLVAFMASVAQGSQLIKLSRDDPSALTTPDVQTEVSNGRVTKTRVISQSGDKYFQSGIYSTQANSEDIDSYPVDEFLFVLEGGAKLKSADGTTLAAKAGDALFIPRGWKGRLDTDGFKGCYVIYSPERKLPAENAHAPTVHPTKISSNDPLAMATPDVQTHDVFKYRVIGKSADGNFRAGLSSMKAKRSLEESGVTVDEVLFMLKGSEKFTSPDGTVIEAKPGDIVFITKGWKGHYDTDGYEEFYVIYGPECMSTNSC